MTEKLALLKDKLNEIFDLEATQSILGWDQQTYMPPGGGGDRGNLLETLSRIMHEKKTSPEIKVLLEDCISEIDLGNIGSLDASLIKKSYKSFQRAERIPIEWVSEFTKTTSLAFNAWEEAREKADFSIFAQHLEKIVVLQKQYADFFTPFEHIYDPFLDCFEPGLKTMEVQEIFSTIRPQQIEIIQAIAAKPQVDDSFLRQSFSEKAQWDFGVDAATGLGYDWQRGRLDKTTHPFTTTFGLNDVRITSRVNPEFFNSFIFGTLHECGHGLFELGFDPAVRRYSLDNVSSAGVHESQSLLYENLVGRSLPFWKFYYPKLQTYFPGQLSSIKLTDFYRAINKVEPSLIRVEADEATYNLHIMLRMDLEISLLEGSLAVKDLPEAWNAKMKEYLGITPPDDAKGVLQDVHWAYGLFGYFPSYALGKLISAHIWETISKEIEDIDSHIENGDFGVLLEWLRANIHQRGVLYEPQELVQKVTGSSIDPKPFMRYLNRKYKDIYDF
ncbi:MAG: carboxypeptidase M32 [Anaerolineaceae bacterium]|nr:carboxypeptidase M32 [Anaerolineaceae bacterium]